MIVNDVSILAAFLMGLIGSVHCVGMCGGIVGALTMGLPAALRQSPQQLLPYLLSYNTGRILSYSVAGMLAGFLGAQFMGVLPQPQLVGKWVAALFMIALGLYVAEWWRILVVLERGGAYVWKWIEPLGKRFFPVKSPAHAFGIGLVWGWLPCGLVYGALALALTSASALQGALLMLAFGLGTLPMLLVVGTAAQWFMQMIRKPLVKQLLGAFLIAFGLMMLFMPHAHKHAPAAENNNAESNMSHEHHHH